MPCEHCGLSRALASGRAGGRGRGAAQEHELGGSRALGQKKQQSAGEGTYHLATNSITAADLWFRATCHIDWCCAAVTWYHLISGNFL